MRRLIPIAALALLGGCQRAPQRTNEVVTVRVARIPLDPADAVWRGAPEHLARLLLQDLVEPRLMKPSTSEVLVRSVNDGARIAFRLEWVDATLDDLPGPGRFPDGCALQLPQKPEPEPPAPQMGEPGRPVEVTFWRADWQASVNGRPDTLQALYPNASVDHYPFQAQTLEPGSTAQKEMARRYAPAQVAGNRRAGPRETPVEDMVASGPGTMAPAPGQTSQGMGRFGRKGWTVVLIRRLPEGLAPPARTQVAFAVWEGSQQEVGSRKMRTGWIPLASRGAP